ncbi:post-GPI attachment to proteins factor 6-like isoform X2 [Ornithodoros turicata]|uniref:post-GPI attachment to proteins factor 6-like isoform X2 n=1 Tax=Ornithodoros turicata TaxID=34597 RepID=UPI003139E782
MACVRWITHSFSGSTAILVIIASLSVLGGEHETTSSWVTLEKSMPRLVSKYTHFGKVVVFHFNVPDEVLEASFHFKANISKRCSVKDLHLYMQHGSFPVVNPFNASFPEHYVTGLGSGTLRYITVRTDEQPRYINVTSPVPGGWFAVSFFIDSDERILQKNLHTPCKAMISGMFNARLANNVRVLLLDQSSTHSIRRVTYFRFMSPKHAWNVNFSVTHCSATDDAEGELCPLIIHAASGVLPEKFNKSDINHSFALANSCLVDCSNSSSGHCTGSVVPTPNVWSYISISPRSHVVNFTLTTKSTVCSDDIENVSPMRAKQKQKVHLLQQMLSSTGSEIRSVLKNYIAPSTSRNMCWPTFALQYVDKWIVFEYGYQFLDTEFSSNSSINVTTMSPTLLTFNVVQGTGTGGTLSLRLVIDPHHEGPSLAELTVRAALSYGTRPKLDPDTGTWLTKGVVEVNTSRAEFRSGQLHVPFPESGLWYLGILPLCTSHHKDNRSDPEHVACGVDHVPLEVHLNGTPCLNMECGKFGTCFQYQSDSFLYSCCICRAGYRGWGCSDDRKALGHTDLLVRLLLLTLSNLVMIPAMVLAYVRHHYLECVVYTAAMLASTFYHMCDAELSPLCVVPLEVLQFWDFMLAIAAFWITLLAIAKVPEKVRSVSATLGVLAIAAVVQYDRTSLAAFALPVTVGISIVLISWARQCYALRTCYPHRCVWLLSITPGFLLTGTGAALYAFFETRSNYAYVHSAWHVFAGLALLCVLSLRQPESSGYTLEDRNCSNNNEANNNDSIV